MKTNLNDLRAFIIVARHNSFTKAAAQLGVSQSALSHGIRGMETRLGIRLFQRTTRTVSLTEAGAQLFQRLSPLFDDIDNEINRLHENSEELQATLRISGSEHAFSHVLWDKLTALMQDKPLIKMELIADTRPVDIIAEGFDAGIRVGAMSQADMVNVRVSDEMPMCVVASPDYLAQYGKPQNPQDLQQHQCVALRILANGALLNWEFCQPNAPHRVEKIQPQGKLIVSQTPLLRRAALSGMGLAWLPRDVVADDLRSGSLNTVLDDWAIHYPPYYLYYPQHRANLPALQLLVQELQKSE